MQLMFPPETPDMQTQNRILPLVICNIWDLTIYLLYINKPDIISYMVKIPLCYSSLLSLAGFLRPGKLPYLAWTATGGWTSISYLCARIATKQDIRLHQFTWRI